MYYPSTIITKIATRLTGQRINQPVQSIDKNLVPTSVLEASMFLELMWQHFF